MIPRLHMKLTIACARITVSHRKFFFPMKEKLFTTNSTRISGWPLTATFSGSCIFSVNRKFIKHLFPKFLLCIAVSLTNGLFLSFLYMHKSHYTKSFVVTLALLPAVVCVVIMMVNGNVGAGVAVAGAFSLVRFRSVPGSAKEIGTIFLAMAAELISGMGYLGYAVLFSLVVGAAMFLLNTSHFGGECLRVITIRN